MSTKTKNEEAFIVGNQFSAGQALALGLVMTLAGLASMLVTIS